MNPESVRELVHDRLLPAFDQERTRLDRIDRWYRWNPEPVKLPRNADPELKYLADLARTPWLRLVVTTVAQTLYLERVYSERGTPDDVLPVWQPWSNNLMDSKQVPLHTAALAYGLSYAQGLPGDSGARITCHSPRDAMAFYGDVVEDDFPMYFIRVTKQPQGRLVRLTDEEQVHFVSVDADTNQVTYLEPRAHGLGYVPVVRYANDIDLEGRSPGEVEPFIPIAARINKTDHDRLLAQHFNSWKVRTATGLDESHNNDAAKMRLRQSDVLTGGEGVTFGTLDETPLDPFVNAHDSDVETLAAVSQTPTTAFGKLINVSAEGLVEARAALYAKRDQRQVAFGGAHAQLLRVCADIEGRVEDAQDFTLRGKWADTESRTLQAAVDALGKAASMLGVPPELLWDYIPGVDLAEAEAWRRFAKENPSPERLEAQAFARQAESVERHLNPEG